MNIHKSSYFMGWFFFCFLGPSVAMENLDEHGPLSSIIYILSDHDFP